MNSRCEKNSLLLLPIAEVADDDVVTVVPSNCLAHRLPLHEMLAFGVVFDPFEISLEACVGVRVAVGDVHCVVVIWGTYEVHGNLTEKVSV